MFIITYLEHAEKAPIVKGTDVTHSESVARQASEAWEKMSPLHQGRVEPVQNCTADF